MYFLNIVLVVLGSIRESCWTIFKYFQYSGILATRHGGVGEGLRNSHRCDVQPLLKMVSIPHLTIHSDWLKQVQKESGNYARLFALQSAGSGRDMRQDT